jgi:hypothetical protein
MMTKRVFLDFSIARRMGGITGLHSITLGFKRRLHGI